MNVVPTKEKSALVVIYYGQVYYIDIASKTIKKTLSLKNCRNVLHQSILHQDNFLCFGEYGNNKERKKVPIYTSNNGGLTWKTVYEVPAGKIKHIHGCYWDKHTQKVWVFTGDFKGENFAIESDKEFKNITYHGDGSQEWRACNAFFEKDRIVWLMDSQLETSYLIEFCRKTKTITKKQSFPGPIWYIKRLSDGYFLAGTTREKGPGSKDNFAHIFVSKDLDHWEDAFKIEHDGLPLGIFKNAVIGFADGEQSSSSFYAFFEATKKYDGRSVICNITS
jgi:hypothetical protein